MARISESHARVIGEYLAAVEYSAGAARAALDRGDEDGMAEHLDSAVHAARQAQARTEQATMLAAERGD